MANRWIIGLASGSSGAGVEATLLEIDGAGLICMHVSSILCTSL